MSVMAARLGGGGEAVLEEISLFEPGLAREPPGQVVLRRSARKRAEVAVEVGLVVVAAVERDLGQRQALGARLAQHLDRRLEAEQPGVELGRHAHVLAEAGDEALAAPAQLAGERADRDGTVRRRKAPP